MTAIFEDREQDVWVGSQDGLVLLGKTALTAMGTAAGLGDADITTISAGLVAPKTVRRQSMDRHMVGTTVQDGER